MQDDRHWMEHAIAEAEEALDQGEVPVGAVVVRRDQIIGRGHNRVEQSGFPFEHAEVVAMWDAVKRHDRWQLAESVLYVTVEPCVMCVGAILLARLPRVVYGVREPRTGACESVFAIPTEPRLHHRVAVVGGIEEKRCRELLQRSFREQRKKRSG
ncbi:MAG: nucleoside deaminase [Candidatus Krumholzibacteria bacterium]|nr:nucleoside deaminase [Candidatus Krumholzibacteria bacterium]